MANNQGQNYNQYYNQGYNQQQQPSQAYQPFDQQQSQQQPLQANDQYYNQGQQQQAQQWYASPNSDQLDYSKVGDLEFQSRSGFVKKVYVLLAFELASTLMLTWTIMNTSFGNAFVQQRSYYTQGETYTVIRMTGFYYFVVIFCFILQIAIFCCSHLARKVPLNYFLMLLYITFYGFMIGGICQLCNVYYADGQAMVWGAWLITFALVLSLTAYACLTKQDMSMKGGFLFVLIMPLFCLMILSIFYVSKILYLIICTLVIIIYGFYLIWETQIIMGGKKIQLSVDDYIIGSLILYGTIVQLFLRILEIIALSKK